MLVNCKAAGGEMSLSELPALTRDAQTHAGLALL